MGCYSIFESTLKYWFSQAKMLCFRILKRHVRDMGIGGIYSISVLSKVYISSEIFMSAMIDE